MKTNYMIALNEQWKAPWRMPKLDTPLNPKASTGNQGDNKFQNLLGRIVNGVQDFIKKNLVE